MPDGLLSLPARLQCTGEVEIGIAVRGIPLQGCAQFANRLVGAAGTRKQISQIVVRVHVSGVVRQRLAERLDCVELTALRQEQQAVVVVVLRLAGRERECASKVLGSLLEGPVRRVGSDKVDVCVHEIGCDGQGLLECLDSFVTPSARVQLTASFEVVIRPGLLRLDPLAQRVIEWWSSTLVFSMPRQVRLGPFTVPERAIRHGERVMCGAEVWRQLHRATVALDGRRHFAPRTQRTPEPIVRDCRRRTVGNHRNVQRAAFLRVTAIEDDLGELQPARYIGGRQPHRLAKSHGGGLRSPGVRQGEAQVVVPLERLGIDGSRPLVACRRAIILVVHVEYQAK